MPFDSAYTPDPEGDPATGIFVAVLAATIFWGAVYLAWLKIARGDWS